MVQSQLASAAGTLRQAKAKAVTMTKPTAKFKGFIFVAGELCETVRGATGRVLVHVVSGLSFFDFVGRAPDPPDNEPQEPRAQKEQSDCQHLPLAQIVAVDFA
jgi:hypothetical protein